MKTTLFAALAAASLAIATPALAGSQSYPEGPAQAIVASPAASAGYARAYPGNGPVITPLSAATAVNANGSQREPEFAGPVASYGTTAPALAQTPAAHING